MTLFISDAMQVKVTGYWYVCFGKIPDDMNDFMDNYQRPKNKYIIQEKMFKRKINAEKYIARIKSRCWQKHFMVTDIQLN